MAVLKLLENAELFAPEPRGNVDLVFDDGAFLKIGNINKEALLASGIEVECIDAKGNYVIPGIIDPHAHLLGGSGENGGFSSQTPEISLTEFTKWGTTTVVGTLGADTTMKTMSGLLAKVKGLREEGMAAYLYTGGYSMPPATILQSAKLDIMFINEVIGTGELAIADERSDEPPIVELAKVVNDTHLAGMLADKAGVTHFHVGKGKRRLNCLFELLEDREMEASWLYPTHINRSKELIEDAIKLIKKGAYADMDTVDEDLAKWLKVYVNKDGPLDKLTFSSDAALTSPSNLLNQFRDCILNQGYKIEDLLPCVTLNTSRVLKFHKRGRIKEQYEPSMVVLDKKDLEVIHVISKGQWMVKDGLAVKREKFLEGSNREVVLEGRPDKGED